MISIRIAGATRVLGKAQGYNGLAVRDEEITVYDEPVPSMVTAWEPTPQELERLCAGAHVEVHIIGEEHPPIRVEVGAVPE